MCGVKALKLVSMHAICSFIVQSNYIVGNYGAFSTWQLADPCFGLQRAHPTNSCEPLNLIYSVRAPTKNFFESPGNLVYLSLLKSYYKDILQDWQFEFEKGRKKQNKTQAKMKSWQQLQRYKAVGAKTMAYAQMNSRPNNSK